MIDATMLDMLMSKYGRLGLERGGYDTTPRLSREQLEGDAPAGNSLQDMYDFLMTPRHRRERSSHGAITHYGPSRRASISPEDQASAALIMQKMQEDEMHQAKMDRVGRADQMMTGRGPEAGGTITYGGEAADIGPKQPMTPADRMTGLAGGMDVDPYGLAEARYGGTAERSDMREVRYNLQNAEGAKNAAQKAISELESKRATYPELDQFEGISMQELADKWLAGELSKDEIAIAKKHLGEYNGFRQSERLWRARAESSRRRDVSSQVQDVGGYLESDGQIAMNDPIEF